MSATTASIFGDEFVVDAKGRENSEYLGPTTYGGAAPVTPGDARRTGDALGVNWQVVPVGTFQRALDAELEHTDVTHGDLLMTGRIALAHLREDPLYYTRLETMEDEARAYWATRQKPSPTLGGARTQTIVIAVVILVAILVIAFFAWRLWKKKHPSKEGLLWKPFREATGYEIPVPGDPDRNILRRSRPYPPGRYPTGGLADFYFVNDPAYSSSFETDYCWHAPAACSGFALEPFCSDCASIPPSQVLTGVPVFTGTP